MYPDAEARLGPEWGGESVVEGAWDIRVTRAIWSEPFHLFPFQIILQSPEISSPVFGTCSLRLWCVVVHMTFNRSPNDEDLEKS